jgi:hypothetical protein
MRPDGLSQSGIETVTEGATMCPPHIPDELTAYCCKKMEGVHSSKMAVHFFQIARPFPRIRQDMSTYVRNADQGRVRDCTM